MSRTVTPAYRLEMLASGGIYTAQAWRIKDAGRPTAANLAKDIALFEASTQPGGYSAHLGPVVVHSATIVHQATRTVVAAYGEAARNG